MLQKVLLAERASSRAYISHLRKKGVKIGEDVNIYVPSKTLIDEQYPWMIEIGNHVRITQGVIILTHDYSWFVLKRFSGSDKQPDGAVLGSSGKVVIGNNVFIGMNAIITADVKIGNNVIIGAGSVVTKDCLENGVYAGNPARRIMDIDEFYKKRQALQLSEAKELAKAYYEKNKELPKPDIFHEYFMLFSSYEDICKNPVFANKLKKGCNESESIAFVQNNEPMFKSYSEFLDYCLSV